MTEEIYIVKANGEREPFDVAKLDMSLRKSGAPEHLVDSVVREIVSELKDGMSTSDIYTHAFNLLHKKEKTIAIRYSVRRAIMDLGPSGFPFERLVGEILRADGYSIEFDQMVKGHCAEHEIDVVAYNKNKLYMIEAKYHNSIGIQTDLKVALYIKARIDDLRESTFMYGSKHMKLTEGWLITNTKFTSSAIKYAACENIKIIGWNYPVEGSLHDMIESRQLHPITCLTTLSGAQKQALLQNNIVLCKTLPEKQDILAQIGLSKSEVDSVIAEVGSLYGS